MSMFLGCPCHPANPREGRVHPHTAAVGRPVAAAKCMVTVSPVTTAFAREMAWVVWAKSQRPAADVT